KVMQCAITDMDRWLDYLAHRACIDADDVQSRRGLLAIKVRSLLNEYPAALLEYSNLPAAFLEQLRNASRLVVPTTRSTQMPPQRLGELPDLFRYAWWKKAIGR